jgi:hypothetical protein
LAPVLLSKLSTLHIARRLAKEEVEIRRVADEHRIEIQVSKVASQGWRGKTHVISSL